jgi:hypothetical protein
MRLRVVSADGDIRLASVDVRAVRIANARVRCGMAVIRAQFFAAPPRGRAITAGAAVRVDDAIASRDTNVRAVVGRRATAKARRPRRTIGVGEALVVRTPAGPDQACKWEAAAVCSASAIGVGRAGGGSGGVGLAGRSRATLRGAARTRGPMVEGNLGVARRDRSRFGDGRHAGDGGDGVGRTALGRAAARTRTAPG